jgi:hypothetical protein
MLNTPKFLSGRAGICKRFVNLTKIQTVRSLCQKSGLCFRRHLKVDRSLFLAAMLALMRDCIILHELAHRGE